MPEAVQPPYSVYQFFPDETHECVRRAVDAEEAVRAAMHYSQCVGAQVGTTVRVIVTDAMDDCVYEWKRGEGIVWPPPHRRSPAAG